MASVASGIDSHGSFTRAGGMDMVIRKWGSGGVCWQGTEKLRMILQQALPEVVFACFISGVAEGCSWRCEPGYGDEEGQGVGVILEGT